MLLGHSAGAHLCTMAVIELVMKRLMENPQSAIMTNEEVARNTLSRQSSIYSDSMKFEDRHFGRNSSESSGEGNGELQTITSNTGSFFVLNEGDDKNGKKSSESFYVVNEKVEPSSSGSTNGFGRDDTTNNDNSSSMEASAFENIEMIEAEASLPKPTERSAELEESSSIEQDSADIPSNGEGNGDKILRFEDDKNETAVPAINIEGDDEDVRQGMTNSQREAIDMLSSVKVILGKNVYLLLRLYLYLFYRLVVFVFFWC